MADNNIGVSKKDVAKADKLGEAAQKAAGKLTKIAREAIRRTEKISQTTLKAAEKSAQATREAAKRTEEISRAARETAETSLRAATEAIRRVEETVKSITETTKATARASEQAAGEARETALSAKDAAEQSLRTSKEALLRVDLAKKVAEDAVKASQQAIARVEEVIKSASQTIDTARKASQEALALLSTIDAEQVRQLEESIKRMRSLHKELSTGKIDTEELLSFPPSTVILSVAKNLFQLFLSLPHCHSRGSGNPVSPIVFARPSFPKGRRRGNPGKFSSFRPPTIPAKAGIQRPIAPVGEALIAPFNLPTRFTADFS